MPVQQQSNGVDCGVFAIAFISYVLSHYKSPIDAKFNTSKMRSHLLHCLLEIKVTEFPRIKQTIRKCFEKTIKVMLHCSCQMPCRKSDNNVVDRQMAECSGCRGWFHTMCERITTAIFQEKSKDWHCFQCIANKKIEHLETWYTFFEVLYSRYLMPHIVQLAQTALYFNASYVEFFFTYMTSRDKMWTSTYSISIILELWPVIDKKRRYITLLTWSIDCSVICSLETLRENVTWSIWWHHQLT